MVTIAVMAFRRDPSQIAMVLFSSLEQPTTPLLSLSSPLLLIPGEGFTRYMRENKKKNPS